jgi:formylglycine-generating enzyme required for sulfatase activity
MIKIGLLFIVLMSVSFADMKAIGSGSFEMGNSTGEDDEKPVHSVTLSSYSIDKKEITNEDYDKCVKSGSCSKAHYTDSTCFVWSSKGLKKTKMPARFAESSKPVVCVSWYQARKYCKWAGKRLPSEAEWEYAATNGGKQGYSTGESTPSKDAAQYKQRETAKTGSFSTGAYDLSDMCGNGWEWVNDRYESEYYRYSEKKNPKGPAVGRFRVVRGGGWYSSSAQLRGSNRHWFAPEAPEASVGFRCAK